MKSLALRLCMLLALGLVAHTVKPFTATNIAAFALASARSLASCLPASTVGYWEKTAVLAAVLNQSWSDANEIYRSNWQTVIAANVPAAASATEMPERNGVQPKAKAKRKTFQPMAVPKVEQAAPASIETALAPIISWQSEELVEPSVNQHEGETLTFPTVNESSKAFALPRLLVPTTKGSSCEIPQTEPPVVVPVEIPATDMASPQAEPTPNMMLTPAYPKRTEMLIEIQPIRLTLSPAQRRVLNKTIQQSL